MSNAPSPSSAEGGVAGPIDLQLRFDCVSPQQFIERHAADLSRGGIFVRSRERVPVGRAVRLDLQLGDGSPLIVGEGMVFWTRDPDVARGEPDFGLGVRFGRLTPPSQKMLSFLLAEKAQRERMEAQAAASGEEPDEERTVVATQEQLRAAQAPGDELRNVPSAPVLAAPPAAPPLSLVPPPSVVEPPSVEDVVSAALQATEAKVEAEERVAVSGAIVVEAPAPVAEAEAIAADAAPEPAMEAAPEVPPPSAWEEPAAAPEAPRRRRWQSRGAKIAGGLVFAALAGGLVVMKASPKHVAAPIAAPAPAPAPVVQPMAAQAPPPAAAPTPLVAQVQASAPAVAQPALPTPPAALPAPH
jgi:uncharacterized protein (TIGR02266 family)